jgi:hypothetical protein
MGCGNGSCAVTFSGTHAAKVIKGRVARGETDVDLFEALSYTRISSHPSMATDLDFWYLLRAGGFRWQNTQRWAQEDRQL